MLKERKMVINSYKLFDTTFYSVHLYRDTDFSMSLSITNGSSFVHTAVNIEKLIIKLVENLVVKLCKIVQ